MYDSLQMPAAEVLAPTDDSENKIVEFQDNNISMDLNTQGEKPIYDNLNTTTTDDLIKYYNQSLGIQFQYPSFLDRFEKDQGVLLTNDNQTFGITLVNLPLRNISSEGFTNQHLSTLNNTLANFNIINSSTSNLLGDRTYMILFTYNENNQLHKVLQLWKLSANNVYIFTYFADSNSQFNNFISYLTWIVETTKVI